MSLMQLAHLAAAAEASLPARTPSRSPTPPTSAMPAASSHSTMKRTSHSPLPSVRALFPSLLSSPRAGPSTPTTTTSSTSHSQFAAAHGQGLTQVPHAPNRSWHDPGQPSTSSSAAAVARTPLQYAPNSYPQQRDEYRRPSPPHQHQHQHQPSHNSSSCCCHCAHSHSHSHTSPNQTPSSAFPSAPAPTAPTGPSYTVLAPSPSGLAPVQTDASRPIGIVRVGRDGRVSGAHATDEREQREQRFHPYQSGSGSGSGRTPPRMHSPPRYPSHGHAVHQPAERERHPYEAGPASAGYAMQVPHQHQNQYHQQQQQVYQHQQVHAQPTFGTYLATAPASSGSGSGTGGKKHVCDVCGAGFSRPSELKTHSHKHTGERPFTCGLCARNFSTSSNLGRHVRSIHPREREQAMRLARGPGGVGVGAVKVQQQSPASVGESIKDEHDHERDAERLGLPSPPASTSGSPAIRTLHPSGSPAPSNAALLPVSTSASTRGFPASGALRLEIPGASTANGGSVSSMSSGEMSSAGGSATSATSPSLGDVVPMSGVEASA